MVSVVSDSPPKSYPWCKVYTNTVQCTHVLLVLVATLLLSPTLVVPLVVLGHAGQQLDGVLGPHPDRAVQLLLQHVVVIPPRGAHHVLNITHKLLSLHQLNASIHLKATSSVNLLTMRYKSQ